MLDRRTTYESGDVGRDDKVWVSTPGSGLDKRQCTLQVEREIVVSNDKISVIVNLA